MKTLATLLLFAFLTGCTTAVTDAGCATYGQRRPSMPPLGLDEISRWVDVTDGAMTATCR